MQTPIPPITNQSAALVKTFHLEAGSERLVGSITESFKNPRPRILALHGAGKATRGRIQYLLSSLAEHGISSVSFDFSGHGESSGILRESSLQKRNEETKAVFEQFFEQDLDLCIATSMGAHVATVALPFLRPRALALFCPAAFAEEAQSICFDEAFTTAIRRTESYRSSLAFRSLHHFFGRLLVVTGANDDVIPQGVLDLYAASSSNCSASEVLELKGAGHHLHAWLSTHPDERGRVLTRVLRLVGALP